jgi:hypothetical protein
MTQRLPADDVGVLDRGVITLTTNDNLRKPPGIFESHVHCTMWRGEIIILSSVAAVLAIIPKYNFG